MAIYRFWLNPFREDRSKTACWVLIDRSHLSAVGDPNPVNQPLTWLLRLVLNSFLVILLALLVHFVDALFVLLLHLIHSRL
jgi:hypothetical protein